MLQRLRDILHRPAGIAAASKRSSQTARSSRASTSSINVASSRRLTSRRSGVSKRGSVFHSGWPSTSAMRSPVRLIRAADRHAPVAAAIDLVRCDQRMSGAGRLRHDAFRKVAGRVPVQLLQRGLQQRRIDALSEAGAQPVNVRSENADRGENAGVDVGNVGNRHARLHRFAAIFTGDADEAAERLQDQVEAAFSRKRSGAAIAGDRAIDQRGVDLTQPFIAQSEPLHHAEAEVLGQHVGLRDHPEQRGFAGVALDVDADRPLAAIEHHERRRQSGVARAPVIARVVAVREFLDLVDVGAHVGQHQAARGAGHDLRQFEHLHAL